MPPAIWKARSEMPIASTMICPSTMKKRSTPNETSTAKVAILRLAGAV